MPHKLVLIAAAVAALWIPPDAHAGYIGQRVELSHASKATVSAVARSTAASRECPNEDLVPTAENLDEVRAAVVCLHNQVRGGRGLPSLKGNARLRRAAEGHSADMVRNGFFEHTTPSGTTMVDRILRARYVRRDEGWVLGENLAWGTGRLGTPRGAIEAWMDSPGHRANVLKRSFREMGVGIALGVPRGGASGVTYTVDFGARR